MKERKKKWYETWWGLLWTLAIVDAHPGSGLQAFLEVDRHMRDLIESEEGDVVKKPVDSAMPQPAGALPVFAQAASKAS